MYDVNAKRQAITNTCACARFGVLITPRPLFSSPFTSSSILVVVLRITIILAAIKLMISYSSTFSSSKFSSSKFSSSTSYLSRHSCTLLAAIHTAIKHIDILLNDIILATL